MKNFHGTGVALVTPFTNAGDIDYVSLTQLIDHVVADGAGVEYLVVLGTTGENATLSHTERSEIFRFVADIVAEKYTDNNLALVAGIGGNNTAVLIDELTSYDLTGYDAILSVSPYYNKPSSEGIYQHYAAIAAAAPLPIILYNVPSRTGSNMTTATTVRLSHIPNIIGIKEASGDLAQITEIIHNCAPGFVVISGDDLQTPDSIRLGGVGVISVLANAFPIQFSRIVRDCGADTAADMSGFAAINPHLYTEGNPVGIKTILAEQGIIATNTVRLPLVSASDELTVELRNQLAKLSI